jgi:hypothetical protein
MTRGLRTLAVLALLAVTLTPGAPALAQKQGGVLRVYHRDSPASMSIHEEGTVGVIMPMMGVDGGRSGDAQKAGMEHRLQTTARLGASGHLSFASGDLMAAASQGLTMITNSQYNG